MIANHLLRRTAIVSARSFSVSARASNQTPHLKREGPAAPKGDKQKFDDGRKSTSSYLFSTLFTLLVSRTDPSFLCFSRLLGDDPNYPGVKEKQKAMNDPYPNRPNADRPAPEAESPRGHEGAFADHRGKGSHAEGEGLNGAEDAAETRTHHRVGQMAKNAAKSVFGGDKKSFSTFAPRLVQEPTQTNRATPAATEKGSLNEHPGYTTENAPIDSSDPADKPPPPEGAIPASASGNASTKAAAPHPGVNEMADGANQPGAGADAIHPEDRSQKTWGMNARSAQFNPDEGKRQPLRDGGSHEGGFKGQPKNKGGKKKSRT